MVLLLLIGPHTNTLRLLISAFAFYVFHYFFLLSGSNHVIYVYVCAYNTHICKMLNFQYRRKRDALALYCLNKLMHVCMYVINHFYFTLLHRIRHLHLMNQFLVMRKQGKFCFLLNSHICNHYLFDP